jgi:hypothetical protein
LINAFLGRAAVSVSQTPGKTKHLQVPKLLLFLFFARRYIPISCLLSRELQQHRNAFVKRP